MSITSQLNFQKIQAPHDVHVSPHDYLADGQPATAASITDESGVEHSLSYASAMRMLEESRPPIETPVEQLERENRKLAISRAAHVLRYHSMYWLVRLARWRKAQPHQRAAHLPACTPADRQRSERSAVPMAVPKSCHQITSFFGQHKHVDDPPGVDESSAAGFQLRIIFSNRDASKKIRVIRTLSGCKAYPKHAASSALSDRSCSRYLG